MATQWPIVHARLTQILPTLTGWDGVEVFDGPAVTGDAPTSYVTVGYAQDEDSAGSFTKERAPLIDGLDEETGAVRCELVVWSGDADLGPVRAHAFDLIDALDAVVSADQTLGVLMPSSTARVVVDVLPVQNQSGVVQRLPFSVEYLARTRT